jgi:pimeloyl-ACP methyl ester carboxylesterase
VLSDAVLAARLERDGLDAFVALWESQPLLEPAPHVSQQTRAQQHAIRLRHQTQGLANSLRGMGTGSQPSLWSALRQLSVPTLLISGDRDARYCEIASRMRAELRVAQHAVIREAGHTAHVDQPAAFARVVRDYFENSLSPRKVPSGSGRPAAPTDRMHS